jgi:hypothetical protein
MKTPLSGQAILGKFLTRRHPSGEPRLRMYRYLPGYAPGNSGRRWRHETHTIRSRRITERAPHAPGEAALVTRNPRKWSQITSRTPMYSAHSVCRLPTAHGVCRIHLIARQFIRATILRGKPEGRDSIATFGPLLAALTCRPCPPRMSAGQSGRSAAVNDQYGNCLSVCQLCFIGGMVRILEGELVDTHPNGRVKLLCGPRLRFAFGMGP